MQKPPAFFGNLCAKHPELMGARTQKHECTECRAARSAARYEANKDEMKRAAAAHYSKNMASIRQSRKEKRANDAEMLRPAKEAAAIIRHVKALEKADAYHKEYMPKWRTKNAEKLTADGAVRMRKWRLANLQKVRDSANSMEGRAYRAARRAASRLATPAWATDFFITEAYALARLRENICGGKWHVDHIVPLKSRLVCGLHCEANLQVIPALENSSKGNRHWPDMP